MSTKHPTGFHWRLALTLWLFGLESAVLAHVLAHALGHALAPA